MCMIETDMQASPMELETEVKFHLPDPQAIRQRILALGARCRGRAFERNICFDTVDGDLRDSDRLLRLRRDNGIRLTYKAPPDNADGQVKAYREIELELGSFDAMAAILSELGFSEARTYEKWRETFTVTASLGEVHLCLDEMPFGRFLEIEGPPEAIRPMAERLGLDWAKRILADYLAVFEAVCTALGRAGLEPTFTDCEGIGPLPTAVWTELQAG